jgi:ribonuclease HI
MPFDVPIPSILPDHDSNQMVLETKIDGLDKKARHSKTELKTNSEAHLQKHFPQVFFFFVEAVSLTNFLLSLKVSGCASTRTAPTMARQNEPDTESTAFSLTTDAWHFDAEVAAIANAARKISETPIFPLNKAKFVILSDSVSAIQFVTKAEKLHAAALLFKNSLLTSRQQNKELRLQWIPRHCDILGNEKADFLDSKVEEWLKKPSSHKKRKKKRE